MAQGDLLLFHAVPAFVGRVHAKESCSFWIARDEFRPELLIDVDLSRHPYNVDARDVQIDAHRSLGGLTSIGPSFHLASHYGAAYLANELYQKCKTAGKLASWPPASDEDYQYQCIAEEIESVPTRRFRRYYGFKAVVLEARHPLYRCELWAPGASAPQKALWLDYTDRDVCFPGYSPSAAAPFGRRRRASTVSRLTDNTTVPLFLSFGAITTFDISIPKVPKGEGEESVPRQHEPHPPDERNERDERKLSARR